jgi:hypothetical protein
MLTRSVGGCVNGNDGDWWWLQKGKDGDWWWSQRGRRRFNMKNQGGFTLKYLCKVMTALYVKTYFFNSRSQGQQ